MREAANASPAGNDLRLAGNLVATFMVIGNGLIAKAFEKHFAVDDRTIIFASGVSNSTETREAEFARERTALDAAISNSSACLVYFSSCALFKQADQDSMYLGHKRQMEARVLESPAGLVLRLPQVVGRTDNPHTLTNYLRDKILSGEHFQVWRDAMRNLIDVEHVATISEKIIREGIHRQKVIAIASMQTLSMPALVERFEAVLGRRASYALVARSCPLPIDTSEAAAIALEIGIELGGEYAARVLHKYYGN